MICQEKSNSYSFATGIVLVLSPHRFGVMLWSHFSVIR